MKSITLTLLLGAVSLMAAACTAPGTVTTNNQPVPAGSPPARVNATPDELAVARGIFQKDCAACHGSDGTGGTKTVDGQTLKVPTLLEGHALKHSDDEFIQQISNGGDGMPAFKDKISAEDMKNLVRLIRKDFQGQ